MQELYNEAQASLDKTIKQANLLKRQLCEAADKDKSLAGAIADADLAIGHLHMARSAAISAAEKVTGSQGDNVITPQFGGS